MTHADDDGKSGTPLLLSPVVSIREDKRIDDVPAGKTTPRGRDTAGQTAALIQKIHGKHQTVASVTVHGCPPVRRWICFSADSKTPWMVHPLGPTLEPV